MTFGVQSTRKENGNVSRPTENRIEQGRSRALTLERPPCGRVAQLAEHRPPKSGDARPNRVASTHELMPRSQR